MSQIPYYSPDPIQHLPHRSGLAAWGVTLIVFGSLAGLFGLIALLSAIAFISGLFPNPGGQSPSNFIVLIGIYAVAAVALIWLGIGSRRGRRWVRPLMIVGTLLVAIGGLSSLAALVMQVVSLTRHPPAATSATPGLPASFLPITMGIGGCFVFVLAEILPLIMLWFYARPSVQETLDILDPHPRWTDRCPLRILAWCGACFLMGLGLLALVFKPCLPFFTAILVGLPAIAVALVLTILMLAGVYLCYKQNTIGWAMTFIGTLVLAASNITFALVGDHKLYFSLAMKNLPPASRDMAERMAANLWIAPGITYLAALLYALWLLKRFKEPVTPPLFPTEE